MVLLLVAQGYFKTQESEGIIKTEIRRLGVKHKLQAKLGAGIIGTDGKCRTEGRSLIGQVKSDSHGQC